MRASVLLAFLAIVENVVYGFSQQPAWSRVTLTRPTTAPVSNNKMPNNMATFAMPRGGGGGGVAKLQASSGSSDVNVSLTSLWGTTGVLYILAKAIKRVLPIALEPFQGVAPALSQFQLGWVYVLSLDV